MSHFTGLNWVYDADYKTNIQWMFDSAPLNCEVKHMWICGWFQTTDLQDLCVQPMAPCLDRELRVHLISLWSFQ